MKQSNSQQTRWQLFYIWQMWISFIAICTISSVSFAAPKVPKALLANSLVYCTRPADITLTSQQLVPSRHINMISEQIYDKLIEYDPTSHTFKPSLAEHFSVSQDGRVITLHLRRNVAFQQTAWFTPTRTLNEEDVIFSLYRMLGDSDGVSQSIHHPTNVLEQQHNALLLRGAVIGEGNLRLKENIIKIVSEKPYQVQIYLAKPDNSILPYLASSEAGILSKEYALQLSAEENSAQLAQRPVGTGAYQLQSYVDNEYARLTPHWHYWGNKAYIEHMIIDFSSDSVGRMAKFLNNECDILDYPEPSHLTGVSLRKYQGRSIESVGENLAFLAFNPRSTKVQDFHLRHNISQGINRQRIADQLFLGTADIEVEAFPTQRSVLENKMPLLPRKNMQNVDRLLLWVVAENQIYNPHPLKMALMIQADLKKIGIDLAIRLVSRQFLNQQSAKQQADYDLILSGKVAQSNEINDFPIPALLGCDRAETRLWQGCTKAFAEENTRERNVDDISGNDLSIIPLVSVKHILLVKDRVKNVAINVFGQVKLSQIRLINGS